MFELLQLCLIRRWRYKNLEIKPLTASNGLVKVSKKIRCHEVENSCLVPELGDSRQHTGRKESTKRIGIAATVTHKLVDLIEENYAVVQLHQPTEDPVSASLHIRQPIANKITSVNGQVLPRDCTC